MIPLRERERRISEALHEIKDNQLPVRRAAEKYEIPRNTLAKRLNGAMPKYLVGSHTHRLLPHEEEALVEYALDADFLGHPLSIAGITKVANDFLIARGCRRVNIDWARRFIKRSKKLRTHHSRSFDCERAFSGDPTILKAWFQHFSELKDKYDVQDHDIYNMDETGFPVGVMRSHLSVTDASRVGKGMKLQPGNKEWVMVIVCIGGGLTSVPPVIGFRGAQPQGASHGCDLPEGWRILVSDKEWSNNEIALQWIEHFNNNTPEAEGRYRMLILDGHTSHSSEEFKSYCARNNILLAYLPPLSSHRSQPLDVGCFRPLKHFYSQQMDNNSSIQESRITKNEFLIAFKEAFTAAMTPSNIKGSFKDSGLIPLDSSAVLSKLGTAKRKAQHEEPENAQQSASQINGSPLLPRQSSPPCPPSAPPLPLPQGSLPRAPPQPLPQNYQPRSPSQTLPPLLPPLPLGTSPRMSSQPPSDIPSSSSSISDHTPRSLEEYLQVCQSIAKDISALKELAAKKIHKIETCLSHLEAFARESYAKEAALRAERDNEIETMRQQNSSQMAKESFLDPMNMNHEEGQARLLQDEAARRERAIMRANDKPRECRGCHQTGHDSRNCAVLKELRARAESENPAAVVEASNRPLRGQSSAEPGNICTLVEDSIYDLSSSPPAYLVPM